MNKRHSKAKSAKSQSNYPKSRRAPNWPVLGLAGLGILITVYLTGLAWWDASPALCQEGSGCDLIQQSRWSKVFGLPLAFWGLLVYALMALLAYSPLAPTKRWTRLWRLAVMGLAISVYLTIVGIVALNAVCVWCLASLATMTAIFAVLVWQRPTPAKGEPWWQRPLNSAVLALAVVGFLHFYYNSELLQPPPSEKLEALAKHLEDTGAQFYGASWCPHCQQQKRLFRGASGQLPYVECSPAGRGGPTARACVRENIDNYPTWVIRDKRYEGVLEPKQLANYAGFEWD